MIHNPHDIADSLLSQVKIRPGYQYSLELQISGLEANKDLKSIELEKRKCLLKHEYEQSNLYKEYSHPNCILEHKIAQVSHKIGCLTPDLPYYSQNNTNETKTCNEKKEVELFHYYMSDSLLLANLEEGNCLETCQSTSYSVKVKTEAIDIKRQCERILDNFKKSNQKQNLFLPSKSIHILSFFNKFSLDELTEIFLIDDPCQFLMRTSSVVHFKRGAGRVNVIVQQRKFTFLSQVAAFGKFGFLKNFFSKNKVFKFM